MRLVQHMRRLEARRAAQLGIHQLIEDQEQAERIDRAGVEIVVAIFRIVEMEAAQPAELDEARHDHLDIDIGRMMAEIDQAPGVLAEAGGGQVIGPPILDHGRIEGRLVHLVLGEQLPALRQTSIDLPHRIQIALEGLGEVALAGEVGAVGDPDRERLGSDRLADLDAFQIVLDRLGPRRRIGVGERAELVG